MATPPTLEDIAEIPRWMTALPRPLRLLLIAAEAGVFVFAMGLLLFAMWNQPWFIAAFAVIFGLLFWSDAVSPIVRQFAARWRLTWRS